MPAAANFSFCSMMFFVLEQLNNHFHPYGKEFLFWKRKFISIYCILKSDITLFFKINSNSGVTSNLFIVLFDISDDAQEGFFSVHVCARMNLLLHPVCIYFFFFHSRNKLNIWFLFLLRANSNQVPALDIFR